MMRNNDSEKADLCDLIPGSTGVKILINKREQIHEYNRCNNVTDVTKMSEKMQ